MDSVSAAPVCSQGPYHLWMGCVFPLPAHICSLTKAIKEQFCFPPGINCGLHLIYALFPMHLLSDHAGTLMGRYLYDGEENRELAILAHCLFVGWQKQS